MAVAAVLAVVVLPSRDRPTDPATATGPADGEGTGPWRQLDWTGTLTLSAAVTLGLLALNLAPQGDSARR